MARAPLPSLREEESVPPPPRSDAPQSELIAWCYEVLRQWRHLPDRVTQLEESLGEEGSRAKGRAATGLHLAVEQMAGGVERVVGRLDKIDESLIALNESRKARTDWTTWATRVVLGALLLAIVGGLVAIVVSGARVQMTPAASAAPPR